MKTDAIILSYKDALTLMKNHHREIENAFGKLDAIAAREKTKAQPIAKHVFVNRRQTIPDQDDLIEPKASFKNRRQHMMKDYQNIKR